MINWQYKYISRPIRSVIILLINKSDSRCEVVRFCHYSYDYGPNWTPLSPITITYIGNRTKWSPIVNQEYDYRQNRMTKSCFQLIKTMTKFEKETYHR